MTLLGSKPEAITPFHNNKSQNFSISKDEGFKTRISYIIWDLRCCMLRFQWYLVCGKCVYLPDRVCSLENCPANCILLLQSFLLETFQFWWVLLKNNAIALAWYSCDKISHIQLQPKYHMFGKQPSTFIFFESTFKRK